MEVELKNIVSVTGNYKNIPTSIVSPVSVVTMLKGISITKSADKEIWINGTLTYKIVLNNETNEIYQSPILTDQLNNNLITFIDGSILIDGIKATSNEYSYDEDSNTLTIKLKDLNPYTSSTITFEVNKKE